MINADEQTNTRQLLSPRQAADMLDVSPGTLAVWRSTKRYPLQYIKVGGKVRYSLKHLLDFLALRTVGQK
jgi:hypothetical protein